MQNCASLTPKQPKRDFYKLMNKAKIVLRFRVRFADSGPQPLSAVDRYDLEIAVADSWQFWQHTCCCVSALSYWLMITACAACAFALDLLHAPHLRQLTSRRSVPSGWQVLGSGVRSFGPAMYA